MQKNYSIISSEFQGQTKTIIICANCGYIKNKYEPFMYLSLSIPTKKEIKRHLPLLFFFSFWEKNSGRNDEKVVTALGRTWHPEHFVCSHCRQELGTRNFFERDGQPYCEPDYHHLFSPRCAYCNGPILDVTTIFPNFQIQFFFFKNFFFQKFFF